MKLNLSNVTLVASTTKDHVETLLSVLHMVSIIDFKNVFYFSDLNPRIHHRPLININNFTYIPCPNFKEYPEVCIWFMTEFPHYHHLMGDFIMCMHWDGYAIRPSMWNNAFFNYDFIGAPWLWNPPVVGNNGFCMYSNKFIRAIKELNLPPTSDACHPSDRVLLNYHQQFQEQYGLTIAPVDLAFQFAVEGHRYDQNLSFGFHGLYNLSGVDKIDGVIVHHHHQEYVTKPDWHRYSPKS